MDYMKLRALLVIMILLGALLASGCCVCCIPCGTTRGQGQANEYALPGQASAPSDPAAMLTEYAGDV